MKQFNISYGMFENTLNAIKEINNEFEDNKIDLQDMSECERNSFDEISEQSQILIENIKKYKKRVLEVLNYGSWEAINWDEVSALALLEEQD